MKSQFTFLGLILCLMSFNVQSGQFVLLNESEIQAVKISLAEGSASKPTVDGYKRLIKEANKLLEAPNESVVDKEIIPPGATKHDFVSIHSKYWPDDRKADGFPWVREEDSNPDTKSDKVDQRRIKRMGEAISTLSQAYYFSGDQQYAVKASVMLKTWFLANKTRMTPHLQFAQTKPGIDDRSSSGVIEGAPIALHVLDSINLIRDSGAWPERFDQVMDQWFTQYLKWLTKSKMANKAAAKDDRHGSWYYFQTAALSWYLNDKKTLNKQLKNAKANLATQFDPDGSLPNELRRSKAFIDSCQNLQALTGTAIIADKANKKFWDLPSKSKSSIAKGINFLMPTALSGSWKYDEDKDVKGYACLDSFNRYAEYSNSAEAKSAVNTILSSIGSKEKPSGDEKRAYYRFALHKPQLVSQ